MDDFVAHVQYDDFVGTAAVDESDNARLGSYLEAEGLIDESERVVGIRITSGENGGLAPVTQVGIVAYICAAADLSNAPTNLRGVEIQVTPGQAFAFFKRFSVVMSRRGMDLTKAEVDGPHWD